MSFGISDKKNASVFHWKIPFKEYNNRMCNRKMFQKQNTFIIFKNILQKKHLNIFLVSRIKKNDNRKRLYNNFI